METPKRLRGIYVSCIHTPAGRSGRGGLYQQHYESAWGLSLVYGAEGNLRLGRTPERLGGKYFAEYASMDEVDGGMIPGPGG